MLFCRFAILGIVCYSSVAALSAQTPSAEVADIIKPPFGLQWGESSKRIETLLTAAKARIVERRKVEERDAWSVEGLVQAGLKRTIFYFKNGKLVEIELQYQDASWSAGKYDEFMSDIRKRIDQKYGANQLIERSKTPVGEVLQTVVGYKWNKNNTAIELFYYSAENASQIYRTVSVHYKG